MIIWPVLDGTVEQVHWAEIIREQVITNLRSELSLVAGTAGQVEALTQIYVAVALRQTAAQWWIDLVHDAAGTPGYEPPRRPAAIFAPLRTDEDKRAIEALRG